MFDYDWFHGTAYRQQQEEARMRCTLTHFPDLDRDTALQNADARRFFAELEVRRLVYLRDGFSYEIRQLAELPSKSHCAFECEPVDEHYKVGAFVVSVPFDEIVRVEVYAVHPSEKPEDSPQITGFRSRPDEHMHHEEAMAQDHTHPVAEGPDE
ncbi:MAG: hypothetical protein H6817_02505 [Phycisphaerales bacterium]|nr:hypothetical protein [Phycisphaerales bacterium]